jgi:FKBP-type peptidyl-prolyl cis-trans isomerase (trigger factor)
MSSQPLSFSVDFLTNHFAYAHVTVPKYYVDTLYAIAVESQQQHTATYGFERGETPVEYVQNHYKKSITDYITDFLFNYFVINFLYDEIYKKKLYVGSEPRIYDIYVEPGHDARFTFEISVVAPIELREWKSFLFKAPKRKNYKDIDRQVESFIQEEHERQLASTLIAQPGDWVCALISLLDKSDRPFFTHHKKIWVKLGQEEADDALQELFLHKSKGDSFTTFHQSLHHYFSSHIEVKYPFCITIVDIVPHSYVCFDQFKHHFKIKTNKEVHQKIIEIFSFRDDISLRRTMVEEALKLLLSKHMIETPQYLILRKQEEILTFLKHNPDYNIYKLEHNFREFVRSLALKQVKEALLIDQLIHQEHINVNDNDVKGYLNLLKRQRTKEFIYFQPPSSKLDGKEIPVANAILEKVAAREKMLNHLIYHLTKK